MTKVRVEYVIIWSRYGPFKATHGNVWSMFYGPWISCLWFSCLAFFRLLLLSMFAAV